MVITYRNRQGQTVQRNVLSIARVLQGNIIGSGDIDNAKRVMNSADLTAWISQPHIYNRLTQNARINVRRSGL